MDAKQPASPDQQAIWNGVAGKAWVEAQERGAVPTRIRLKGGERAAAPLLPNMPPRDPNAPGQFAFADRQKVIRILEENGWAGIDIQPIDVEFILPSIQPTTM